MTRLTTGIQGFDGMVQGGLPVGSSVILQGPPGQEKLSFALTFLAEGLKAGASGLVVISSQSPDVVLAELRNLGVDLDAVTNDHRLRIVDWYSWSEEAVHDIEERGLVLRSSIDLTNLGVALSRAIAALSGDQPRRAVIELLSPATNVYEITQVYAFAQSAKKKFDRHGFTSLVLLEKDMHSGSEITTLHQPFDGVIEIERTRSGDRIVRKIGVLHLKETAPDPTFRVLEVTESGMRVVREMAKPVAQVPSAVAATSTVLESQEERARRLDVIMQIAGERLKLNPRDADALFAMAAAQATLDDPRSALQSLDRLADLIPNYPGLWVLKAKLHARLGEADRARQSRLRAQEVEPAEPTPAEPTVPCPMCNTPVAVDATVCGNCGVKFTPSRKLEDELEDLGHAAIQEMVQEGFQEETPPAAPRKPTERRPPEPEPKVAPAPRAEMAAPRKPAPKPTPKKGLTNGLVLGRGTGRRTGMTNGLRGRTNGLRGRTNGLTNGLGRTNGLTNGAGRTNGLTNGLGRTNGLTNGFGRTNGLTNGLGRTNGITNGLGRTNGLTNGLGRGRPSGFRSTGFRGMMRTAGWKLYVIPLVVVGLLLMPLFFVPEYFGPATPIRIDGQFGDWASVSTLSMGSGGPSPNVDIVGFGMVDNLGPHAFYVRVAGTALQGGGTSPGTMDSARIFVDTDGLPTTGYRVDGIGADRLIEVSGYAGSVRASTLWEFDANRDTRDWSGWIKGTAIPSAASGSQIEAEAEWLPSTPSSFPIAASVHTASWDGETDVGEFPVSLNQGSVSVVSVPDVPAVISGNGVSLLRLFVTGHGQTVSIDSLTVQIVGTAPVTAALSLRIMDGGTVLGQVVPTSRDVTFSFPAIAISDGSTVTLSLVGDFTGTGGDTFGLRLRLTHPFGIGAGAVGLRENPGARTLGYLGSVPGTPIVDGGFGEWTSASTDVADDVTPRANPSIDLIREGAIVAGGSSYLYADVTGRILQGTSVPEFARPTLIQGPPAPADTDRDTVPDSLDPFPLDFNNDGTADAQTNSDYDGDGITDYGFAAGTDYWLNTTIPGSFPAPYAGRVITLYIGPTYKPSVLGEDVLRVFLDIDNSTGSGYAVGGIGAERLLEIRGKDTQVAQSALLNFSGSFPGEWAWTPMTPATPVDVALGYHEIEFSVSVNATSVYVEAGDFWGSIDTTTAVSARAPPASPFQVAPSSLDTKFANGGSPGTRSSQPPVETMDISGNQKYYLTDTNHATETVCNYNKVASTTQGTAPSATVTLNAGQAACWYVDATTGTTIPAGSWESLLDVTTAGVSVATGSFSVPTALGGTVTVSGLSFQPKAMQLWWSGRTGTTDTAGTADHQRGFGFGVSTTDRRAVCSMSEDNVGNANTRGGHRIDAVVCTITTASPWWDGLLDIQSINSDGATFVTDDAFSVAVRVHYLMIGGGGITNAATGQFNEAAAAGNQDITTVGFQPELVVLMSADENADAPSTTADSRLSFGVAAGAGNPTDYVWAGGSDDAAATKLAQSYSLNGESIALLGAGNMAPNARAEVDAWLSNGFSLDWKTATTNARRIHFLAIDGGQWAVGDVLTRTNTANFAETGVGFQPVGALFVSHDKAQSTVNTAQAHDEWSMGAATGASNQRSHCTVDEDNVATSDVGTSVQHNDLYCNLDLNMAIEGLMDLVSFDADGFTLAMANADPSQAFVWYLAIAGTVKYDVILTIWDKTTDSVRATIGSCLGVTTTGDDVQCLVSGVASQTIASNEVVRIRILHSTGVGTVSIEYDDGDATGDSRITLPIPELPAIAIPILGTLLIVAVARRWSPRRRGLSRALRTPD